MKFVFLNTPTHTIMISRDQEAYAIDAFPAFPSSTTLKEFRAEPTREMMLFTLPFPPLTMTTEEKLTLMARALFLYVTQK